MTALRTKTFHVALLSAGLFAGAAFAQTAGLVDVDDNVMVPPFNVTVDDLDDMDVYDAAGTEIGEIEEVVGTDANTPTAFVVDFDDQGYGDEERVIGLENFAMDGARMTLSLDAAGVATLPVDD
ncbi:PRC-barrel domain-containing protein [Aurantimonas sp. HBX-1]|uniref:PRC-barrel domain-containing protein n=1 Tax=Aurantimonas sp. HBX-1 TaxID=2906072 RepID=UPI001F1B147A|nr:PRC-barrel domain-containing protein [Aurantimonas sp. HBX-1]UIJ73518.1 PRC-barrel domain-containing protein [Aurantimonas sp. HBX-1]